MKLQFSPIITLSKSGSRKLDKIMREPASSTQVDSFKQSLGLFDLYQKRWQKKDL
jgi:hypothetical protein